MTDLTLRDDVAELNLDLDHFDHQARALFETWAAKNRELKRTLDSLDDTRHELADAKARIVELERSNAQLHERVGESMSREALAHAEAARLAGIMQVTGNSLADGMAKAKTAPPTFLRPRPVT